MNVQGRTTHGIKLVMKRLESEGEKAHLKFLRHVVKCQICKKIGPSKWNLCRKGKKLWGVTEPIRRLGNTSGNISTSDFGKARGGTAEASAQCAVSKPVDA